MPFLFPVSPQIKLSPINQSVIDGDSVNFTCRATGVPTPNLTWTFNDGKLPSGTKENKFERDSFVELFLEMQKITKKMEGIYKCTAKNKANGTSYSTILQVFGRFNNYNDYDDNNIILTGMVLIVMIVIVILILIAIRVMRVMDPLQQ